MSKITRVMWMNSSETALVGEGSQKNNIQEIMQRDLMERKTIGRRNNQLGMKNPPIKKLSFLKNFCF